MEKRTAAEEQLTNSLTFTPIYTHSITGQEFSPQALLGYEWHSANTVIIYSSSEDNVTCTHSHVARLCAYATQLRVEWDSVVMGACTSNTPAWASCKMFWMKIAKSRLVRCCRWYAHQPNVWNWSINWTTWADGLLLCEQGSWFELFPFRSTCIQIESYRGRRKPFP